MVAHPELWNDVILSLQYMYIWRINIPQLCEKLRCLAKVNCFYKCRQIQIFFVSSPKEPSVLKWHEVMMVTWRHECDANVMMSLCVKACYKTESTATEPSYTRRVTYQRQMSTCWTASFTTQSLHTSSTSCVHSVSHRLLLTVHTVRSRRRSRAYIHL